jgi:hypothetical protein
LRKIPPTQRRRRDLFFIASADGRVPPSAVDKVTYDRVSIPIEEGSPLVPGAFLKDTKFSSQQEARYALLPSSPIAENMLFINFPWLPII